jgi:hypothetical protein
MSHFSIVSTLMRTTCHELVDSAEFDSRFYLSSHNVLTRKLSLIFSDNMYNIGLNVGTGFLGVIHKGCLQAHLSSCSARMI